MSRNLFWLSDEQWERIKPHLPTDVRGVERADDRRVSGIIHVLKSGRRWCDCPESYGPSTTIYNRFVRWARRGVWENLFRKLAGNGKDIMSVDTNHQAFSSTHGITLLVRSDGLPTPGFIAMDPPRHDEQRKTVSPIVAPGNLAKLEQAIRARVCARQPVSCWPAYIRK